MIIADHPLHRSGRAVLPHPALASGNDAHASKRIGMVYKPQPFVLLGCTTYPPERLLHANSALCPGRGLLWRVPFGQPPSLPPLRWRYGAQWPLCTPFVRGVLGYYGAVRLPLSVHHRRTSLDFPTRPAGPSIPTGGQGISRFPCMVLPRMHQVSDRVGLRWVLRYRHPGCGFPHPPTASAPQREVLSRLHTGPTRSPVNASVALLRAPPHDSGPLWFATPSTYDSFIHYTMPV